MVVVNLTKRNVKGAAVTATEQTDDATAVEDAFASIEAVGDPAANAIWGWNNTSGATVAVTSLSGLTFNGTQLAVAAINASVITAGIMATARLGTGTANSATFLRGDGTWATPEGSGSTGILAQVDYDPAGTLEVLSVATGNIWTYYSANATETMATILASGTDEGSVTGGTPTDLASGHTFPSPGFSGYIHVGLVTTSLSMESNVVSVLATVAASGMSPVLEGTPVTANVANGASTSSVDLSTLGLEEDDAIVVVAVCDAQLWDAGGTTVFGGPVLAAGYTDIAPIDTNNEPGMRVAYLRCPSSPPASVTIQQNGNRDQAIIVLRVSGIDWATPLSGTTTVAGAVDLSTMPNAPSQTTAHDNCLHLIVGALDDVTSATGAAPSGFTGYVQKITNSTGNVGAAAMIAVRDEATAGALDPDIFGGTCVTSAWRALHCAFKGT